MRGGHARLQLRREAVVNLHDVRAAGADEMMVMRVRVARDQLEARRAVAEVEALHHAHSFEQMHGAVEGREVAVTLRQRGVDFLVRHRMPMLAQQGENRLARRGDALRFLA